MSAQIVRQESDEIPFEEYVEFGRKMVELLRSAQRDQVIEEFILRVIIEKQIFFADIVDPRLRVHHLMRGEKCEMKERLIIRPISFGSEKKNPEDDESLKMVPECRV